MTCRAGLANAVSARQPENLAIGSSGLAPASPIGSTSKSSPQQSVGPNGHLAELPPASKHRSPPQRRRRSDAEAVPSGLPPPDRPASIAWDTTAQRPAVDRSEKASHPALD